MPMPRREIQPKPCKHCGSMMERKSYRGRLEDAAVFGRRRFCDLKCSGLASRKADPGRHAYGIRARAFLKPCCERCGTPERLSIHHKDRNWRNNQPLNLATLCDSCHTSLHHEAGDIVQRKPRSPCRICSRPSDQANLDLCEKHLLRLRKYGDPCLTKIKRGSSMVLVRQA